MPSASVRKFSASPFSAMEGAPMAFARASITCVRVSRSNSIAPFTVLTRLGMRSWRLFNCTSIWRQAFSTWFFSVMSPLYAATAQMIIRPSITSAVITIYNGPSYLSGFLKKRSWSVYSSFTSYSFTPLGRFILTSSPVILLRSA